MPANHARTECTLHNDPRLIAAVGAVVSHASERTGLSDEAQAGLSKAAEDACREMFAQLQDAKMSSRETGDSAIHVIVENFPDRVEVAIENIRASENSQLGPDRVKKIQLATKVNTAKYETRDGRSHITLIEYLKEKAPAS